MSSCLPSWVHQLLASFVPQLRPTFLAKSVLHWKLERPSRAKLDIKSQVVPPPNETLFLDFDLWWDNMFQQAQAALAYCTSQRIPEPNSWPVSLWFSGTVCFSKPKLHSSQSMQLSRSIIGHVGITYYLLKWWCCVRGIQYPTVQYPGCSGCILMVLYITLSPRCVPVHLPGPFCTHWAHQDKSDKALQAQFIPCLLQPKTKALSHSVLWLFHVHCHPPTDVTPLWLVTPNWCHPPPWMSPYACRARQRRQRNTSTGLCGQMSSFCCQPTFRFVWIKHFCHFSSLAPHPFCPQKTTASAMVLRNRHEGISATKKEWTTLTHGTQDAR